MPTFGDRLMHAWNAFMNKDPTPYPNGYATGVRPGRTCIYSGNERSIVNAIYNRIAIDVSVIRIEHVKLDKNRRYKETLNSGLNYCLTVESNKDQTARQFLLDAVMSLLDEGCIAIVPIDTTTSPMNSNAFDVNTMRTAKIVEWFPDHIRIRVYNDIVGIMEEKIVPKSMVAIVENPLYSVMNEPNSILSRLIRKLNLLDAIDEQSGSGKLDLIIQLPYVIKTDSRRKQAEQRRKDIEDQLAGSKYGIAYTDGSEHITQLNRSVENNLMTQIEYLTSMLYSQLGLTQSVFDGTADEKTMVNYYNRTIEPIVSAIASEMDRKFISKTARTQGQSIFYFRDPFKLLSAQDLAELADKLTRNEIMTSNEFRPIIGLKPANDPRADELINKNINHGDAEELRSTPAKSEEEDNKE